jgi:hypothetical protein
MGYKKLSSIDPINDNDDDDVYLKWGSIDSVVFRRLHIIF